MRSFMLFSFPVALVGCLQVGDYPTSSWTAELSRGWADVSAGTYATCGVRETGEVLCWGLGDDFDAPPHTNFVKVAVGGEEAVCGINGVGTIDCWNCTEGDDQNCQPPTGIFEVIEGGPFEFCATAADGEVVCWGSLGSRSFSGVVELALGNEISCAIEAVGEDPNCWMSPGIPAWREPPTGLSQLALGTVHGCGLDGSGHPSCWGGDSMDPSMVNPDDYPEPPWAGPWDDVRAGNRTTCLVRGDGLVGCFWTRDDAVVEAPSNRFAKVSVGSAGHVCGLTDGGELACWGPDHAGETVLPQTGSWSSEGTRSP